LEPSLLHSIDVTPWEAVAVLPRLRALHAVLAAHGRHVQRLKLVADFEGVRMAHIHRCLAACGSAGSSMQELTVRAHESCLATTGWLAGLTALRRLCLSSTGRLRLPVGISRLQRLAEAELDGDPIEWGAVRRLPPCLTHLCLEDEESEQLPTQVSKVACLLTCPPACPTVQLFACRLPSFLL